ncbi:MAG: hypothetical protein ORN85_10500, partial [Sediminibacterium sp.]|nr:hypothetical protein [Sediminibacterium sp.]
GLNNVVDISSGPIAEHSFALYKLEVRTRVVNGTISNQTFVKRGDSVRITYQSNSGYVFDYILVNGIKIYDSSEAFTVSNINSFQNITAFFIPQNKLKIASTNKAIFKANDTLVIRGRNLYQLELKTIANQNRQYLTKLDSVSSFSGSNDSLYSFIIPNNLQNVVYKIRGIDTLSIDTSTNSFLIRLSQNYDSLGVIGWGLNDAGQTNIPAGLKNIVQLSAGKFGSYALKFDGSVQGWGSENNSQNLIPEGLNKVVQVSVGDNHGLALKSDGSVVAWGDNSYGQTNVPSALYNIVEVAAGNNYSLALKSDGAVIGWGLNRDGQINFPAGLSNIVQLSASALHCLALKSDSTVVAWGDYSNNQKNMLVGLKVLQLAAGWYFNLLLKSDSSVIGLGDNNFGQTTIPLGVGKVKQIAAGFNHSLALSRSDTISAWGDNNAGQTNIPVGLTNVVDITSGSSADFSFALYRLSVKTKVVNGTISNSLFVKRGDSVRITYQPNNGYFLDYIVVNGTRIYDSLNAYTFRNIDSTQNIEAVFSPIRLDSI